MYQNICHRHFIITDYKFVNKLSNNDLRLTNVENILDILVDDEDVNPIFFCKAGFKLARIVRPISELR